MHKQYMYVGPISFRYRKTPADMPPSSRYRPHVGMFAGYMLYEAKDVSTNHVNIILVLFIFA